MLAKLEFPTAIQNQQPAPASGRGRSTRTPHKRDDGRRVLDEALKQAAARKGCRYLFDLPPAMIGEHADKAAAILCPKENGPEILFMLMDHGSSTLRLIEEEEAPSRIVDFCWSYVRILAHLPSAETNCLQ